MMDPTMQQAMAGMVPGGAPGGAAPGAAPSDQELLMMILELIASGQLQGPGVDAIAQFVGAAPAGGGAAMGAPSGAAPAGGGVAPMM